MQFLRPSRKLDLSLRHQLLRSMLPALLLDDVDKIQIGRDLEFIFLE